MNTQEPNWWVAVDDPELGYLSLDDFDLGDCEECGGEGGFRLGGHPGAVPQSVDCPECKGSGCWAYNYLDEDPFPVEPARCSICEGKVPPDASYPLCDRCLGTVRS